ncbi:hypothetical protein [Microvirga massiliensis]|uniref:hypothetical protein n=1 Tax=Microvirga massiliensis TaxID=1033741 RepID=UPI00062B9EF1|nr:hypothetical protein [Microvirga massiliensis]
MPRARRDDTPDYVIDVIDDAKPIGSQLAAAAGLLITVLIAMSAVEAPMQEQDLQVDGIGAIESPSADGPGLLCSIGGTIMSWIAVDAS